MTINPIAYIQTDFKEKFGIPRQSGRVKDLYAKIVFLPEYRNKDALRGIELFSHLWLIFDFSQSHTDKFSPTVRPPRLGGNERIGVFASRSPFRPNSIGLSSVELVGVEESENGNILIVKGADLLDNTPIYDIKPYIPYTDCHIDAKGGYAEDFANYKLDVDFPENLLKIIPLDKRNALISCLAEDPRPSYQSDSNRIYNMKYAFFDVHFKVSGNTLTVTSIDII